MAEAEQHHTLPLPQFDTRVKLLLVVSPYYKDITDDLLRGARAAAARATGEIEVEMVEVPGALEIPPAIALAQRLSDYHGFVALGCVIRGETSHYETVCNDSSRGLSLLGLQGAAIGNAILTVETHAQAKARANPAQGDKGGGAVAAALHLIALSRKWATQSQGIGFKT